MRRTQALAPVPAMVDAQRRPRSVCATGTGSMGLSVAHGCMVVGRPATAGSIGGADTGGRAHRDRASAKEIEVELGEDADRDAFIADIEASLEKEAGCCAHRPKGSTRRHPRWPKVAYVEVGAPTHERRFRLRRTLT